MNNNPARLDDSQVRWEIGTVTRDGHAAGVDATELAPGPHSVSFIGRDDGGLPASATTTIEVRQSLLPRSGGFEVVC